MRIPSTVAGSLLAVAITQLSWSALGPIRCAAESELPASVGSSEPGIFLSVDGPLASSGLNSVRPASTNGLSESPASLVPGEAGLSQGQDIVSFDVNTVQALGFNGAVSSLCFYNGTLYAAGSFTSAGGVAANHIARWNGSAWDPVGQGLNSDVICMTVFGNKLIVGGFFNQAGGAAANCIAAWDGSSWSPLGSGVTGASQNYVRALCVYGDGLIAGGSFTLAGGASANYIARWYGGSWSPLGSGVSGGSDGPAVDALMAYGGDVVVGGAFDHAGGVPASYIARWNGSTWGALGSGVNLWVTCLSTHAGKLVAGGWFTKAGGISANSIATWNGSSWAPLGSGMNAGVYAIMQYGATLYAAGNFTTAGGSTAKYVASWNGYLWSPLGSGTNNWARALNVYGSDILLGGGFTIAGGQTVNYLASWQGNGWSAFPHVIPLVVSYAGLPNLRGDYTSVVIEDDHRINAGDHVHLRLPFVNNGGETAHGVVVTLSGRDEGDGYPSVRFWDPVQASWRQEVQVQLGDVDPGPNKQKPCDVTMYVGKVDPDSLNSLNPGQVLPRGPEISLNTNYSQASTVLTLELGEIEFGPRGVPLTLTAEDCLHHSLDVKIRRFANWAIGADQGDLDAESPDKARLRLEKVVDGQFHHGGRIWSESRIVDTQLLERRGHVLGVCAEFADLTLSLARSLGIPTRYMSGQFAFWPIDVGTAHAWNEAYVDGQWKVLDAGLAGVESLDNKHTYADWWGQPRHVYADVVPLANVVTYPWIGKCVVECSSPSEQNCQICMDSDNRVPYDSQGCQIFVTDDYRTTAMRRSPKSNADFALAISGPTAATAGLPFSAEVTLRNTGAEVLSGVTVSFAPHVAGAQDSLYLIEPRSFSIDSLAPGRTWTGEVSCTPVHASAMATLDAYAAGTDGSAAVALLPQSVNEAGTAPDLLIQLAAQPDRAVLGQPLELRAVVRDEQLARIVDAEVHAEVVSVDEGDFDAIVTLGTDLADSAYSGTILLPEMGPRGSYMVTAVASRAGNDPDTSAVNVWVQPALTVVSSSTAQSFEVQDSVRVTALVTAGGEAQTNASVLLSLIAGADSLVVPLAEDSAGTFRARTVPANLAISLGRHTLPDGTWLLRTTATSYGAVASDLDEIQVRVPDLCVRSGDLTVEPAAPRAGDLIMATALVRNLGSGSARSIVVRFYLSAPDSTGQLILPAQVVPRLGPDSVAAVTASWQVPNTSSRQTVWAWVDQDSTIIETDKANNSATIVFTVVGVEDVEGQLPRDPVIARAWPNPSHGGIDIEFALPARSGVKLDILDVRGRRVAAVGQGEWSAGHHTVEWDGRDVRGRSVGPGLYFVRLEIGGRAIAKKVVILP